MAKTPRVTLEALLALRDKVAAARTHRAALSHLSRLEVELLASALGGLIEAVKLDLYPRN